MERKSPIWREFHYSQTVRHLIHCICKKILSGYISRIVVDVLQWKLVS